MSRDFDKVDFAKQSLLQKIFTVGAYKRQQEGNAFSAWQNTDQPYTIGDMKPLDALLNAKDIYLLSDTKMGRPAVMELEGTRYMCVTLKRHLVYENNEPYYGLIAKQNGIKREELYLYKCGMRMIMAQMHNFKCDVVCLMDANKWHDIKAADLEEATKK